MKKKTKKTEQVKQFDLKAISNPDFVKQLTYPELTALASDIRQEILLQIAKNGGHLSSNLGTVEATIALFRNFDFPHDKLLFDVGHQAYTQKILTGRSLATLRKKNGVSGYQKCLESPYDQYEAGHSSTSIGAATGMAIARDLNEEKYEVVAFIGDAAIANGVAFEGLNYLGHSMHKVIIVLNDNDMSITQPVGAFSRLFRRLKLSSSYIRTKDAYRRIMFKTRLGYHIYRFTWWFKNFFARLVLSRNFFEQLGFDYIGTVDGHDFKALDKAFKKAHSLKDSVIVHLRTTKGKGYPYSEKDDQGDWHGVSSFDIKTGISNGKNVDIISWSNLYADLTLAKLKADDHTIVITPATLKGSGLEKPFAQYRRRTIDVGIAEENAFLVAQGLALSGKYPIVSIYSTFMQRGFDQIIHDLARMNLSLLVLVDRAGLVGADGETHQGIFDSDFLLGIPNITVAMAANARQAQALMNTALGHKGPFFVRYPRDFMKKIEQIPPCELPYGKWETVQTSRQAKLAVVTYGPLIEALQPLVASLDVSLINAIYQKPLDYNLLDTLLKYQKVILIDGYATNEGFNQQVMSYLYQHDYQGKVITRAVPTSFIEQATIAEQMEEAGLAPHQLLALIKELLDA